jgi:hypothetical protein
MAEFLKTRTEITPLQLIIEKLPMLLVNDETVKAAAVGAAVPQF